MNFQTTDGHQPHPAVPDADPVSWVRSPQPDDVRLRAENRTLRERIAKLTDQLETLQHANEGWYRLDYDRTGGSRFDRRQQFPSHRAGHPAAPTTEWFTTDQT